MATLIGVALCLCISAPSAAQYQGCPLIQQITLDACEVLERLFTETGGPEWFHSRGWLRSNQPCDWYGVTCVSGAWPRRITRIELPGNNLAGSLPGELSLLTNLRVLIIDNRGAGIRYKKLSGNIPTVLGQLEHLEVLRLDDNEFTGTIPLELGKLSSLRTLGLSQNMLSGPLPSSFGNLSAVSTLDLSENMLSGSIPDSLQKLQALEFLGLSGNLLEGPVPASLGVLTNLTALDLSENDLEGSLPEALTNLGRLAWLSVADNNLEGPLPLALATFGASINTCLMERNRLCLPSDPPYRVLGPGPVCGLPPAASCRVCESPACEGLEALYYATDGQTWADSDGWLASPSPCKWSGIQCDADRLTHLSLISNGLRGMIPEELGQLTEMTHLDLAGNVLLGEIPAELGSLTSLLHLDLSDNNLSGQVSLPVATLGADLPTCDFSNNVGLCVPDEAEYRALSTDLICGLPLNSPCSPHRLVAITSLEIETRYNAVLLSWQTDQVPMEVTFEVQQQEASGDFKTIAMIESGGTVYQYPIVDLPEGTHTFRLKQVAPQGAFSYSEVVSVTLVPTGLTIGEPYPVPFATHSTVEFTSGTQQQVRVELVDASGRRVRTLYEQTPPAHQTVMLHIDGSSLGSGLYFVRFLARGRVQGTRTLIRVQ